jgi:hypothetical protein
LRIFDRIASGESVHGTDSQGATAERDSYWRKAVNTSVRFIADEAAQHVFWSDCSDWDVQSGRFGIQMPPFQRTWIEWTTPKTRLVKGTWHKVLPSHNASLLETRNIDEGCTSITVKHLSAPEKGGLVTAMPIYSTLVISPDKTQAESEISYDKDGLKVIDDMGYNSAHGLTSLDELAYAFSLEFWPMHMALGFINWPKVRIETEQAPEKVRRKRERRGSFVGLDYKRMVLPTTVTKALAANRNAERNGVRLHAVTGHFRTYTKPLGGHPNGFVGSVYIPGHWRGDKSLGTVHKEIEVTAESQHSQRATP